MSFRKKEKRSAQKGDKRFPDNGFCFPDASRKPLPAFFSNGLRIPNISQRLPAWNDRTASRHRKVDLKTRYRFYGTNYREKEHTWSRAVQDYKPLFVNMVGFGVASIPNNAGEELDHHRHTLEIRSSEVFKGRRSAFGILFLSHVTKRAALGVPENEDELPKIKVFQEGREEEGSEEVTIHPYRFGYGAYGVYGYSFGGGPSWFDAMRAGGHLALGLYSTADFVAPSGKVGLDLYLGRHWALSTSCLVIGKTENYFGANAILNETEIGGDFTLSYIY